MENHQTPAIGLDFGTSRIVAARPGEPAFQYESQLNAFISVPFSRMTEKVLREEGVPYVTAASELLVHGNEAARFADLLNAEIRRPMTRGFLNPGEPESVKLIEAITRLLTARTDKSEKKTKVCFAVPAAPAGSEESLIYHEASLKQVLESLGFEARSINEGLAVVYGEMEATNYTGIGISCGGGLCNVCMAYLSVPVLSFSIPKAGDFIDASAAAVTGERANRLRILKEESFFLNGHYPGKLQQVLGLYYDDMIRALVQGLKEAFEQARNMPKLTRPIPLVLSGGSAMPKGFRDRFEKILRESGFPVAISEIRLAADPLTTTAKGALVAALSDM
ncbi:MAG TPA: hypothetical protein VG672_02655 [Bryobacteraceae bacterium]|nr:hypothetical protein [Bryobacteraceae bacterium]